MADFQRRGHTQLGVDSAQNSDSQRQRVEDTEGYDSSR